ncbi:MAG: sigma-70 family RNA polymerase sigma factor [Bacteroides sp.]|nr:sigma-70 family RNA polymerase sigma factor [Bacteroides sp.]
MNAESFKKQYLLYHKRLYYTAYRLLKNEADAEDIVQEAYMKLWNIRETLQSVLNTEAFCVTLVKNLCLDFLRSGKGTIVRKAEELKPEHTRTLQATDTTEVKEEVKLARLLITKLPEQQQTIITMRDIKGFSYEEIEKYTGLTQVNIRVLLSRARKKIREQHFKLNRYDNR